MTCPRVNMEGLAQLLTGQARSAAMSPNVARWVVPDRPVFDATGLTGEYDRLIAGWGVLWTHTKAAIQTTCGT